MAENGDEALPLSEPIIIPTIFANGVTVDLSDGVMTITYWTVHIDPPERRIAVRVAIPVEVSRDQMVQTRKLLAKREQ